MDKNLKLGLIVGVFLLGLMVVAIIFQYKSQSGAEEGNLMPDEDQQVAAADATDATKSVGENELPDVNEETVKVTRIVEQPDPASFFEDEQPDVTAGGVGVAEVNPSQQITEEDTILVDELDTKPIDDATITGEIGRSTQEESIKDIPSDFVPERGTSEPAMGGDEGVKEGAVTAPPKVETPRPVEDVEEKTEETKIKTYKVKRGDSLYKIAQQAYGNGAKWPLIYEANKDILRSPNSLRPNQVLKILPLSRAPKKTTARVASSPSSASSSLGPREKQVMLKPSKTRGQKTHKVKKGDNLSKIAYIYYHDRNKWQPIFRANADRIVNKDRLLPGQELVIPSL